MDHIGKIGKPISIAITITGYIHRKSWGSDKRIYLCQDDDKNTITFSSDVEFPIGTELFLEGKIKRHNHFNGQPQTHITDWQLLCI